MRWVLALYFVLMTAWYVHQGSRTERRYECSYPDDILTNECLRKIEKED
jgi:hypothetical protein